MIRSFFITARTGTQGFDAQLIHHVLVILIGSEGYWRRRSGFSRGTLSQCGTNGRSSNEQNNNRPDK
jgi:hypothetical protein